MILQEGCVTRRRDGGRTLPAGDPRMLSHERQADTHRYTVLCISLAPAPPGPRAYAHYYDDPVNLSLLSPYLISYFSALHSCCASVESPGLNSSRRIL